MRRTRSGLHIASGMPLGRARNSGEAFGGGGSTSPAVFGSLGALVNGAKQATANRLAVGSSPANMTSGTLYLVGIELVIGQLLSSITFVSETGPTTPTHQIFGLFDDSLGTSTATPYALLQGSNDDGANAWGNHVAKTLTLTATYTPVRSGFHYLGCLVVAGTAGSLRATASGDGVWNLFASILCGQTTDTGLTALPNPAHAPSTGSLPMAWVS